MQAYRLKKKEFYIYSLALREVDPHLEVTRIIIGFVAMYQRFIEIEHQHSLEL